MRLARRASKDVDRDAEILVRSKRELAAATRVEDLARLGGRVQKVARRIKAHYVYRERYGEPPS